MPQLDFSTYASQAFWMIFFFCLLWGMIALLITPKVENIQEQRKRKIHKYLHKAQELNENAQMAVKRYEKAIEKAKYAQRTQMEKLQQELKEYIDEAEAQSAAKLNQQIASSELLLAKEKQETMQKIDHISQQLALQILHKIGINNITEQHVGNIASEKQIYE